MTKQLFGEGDNLDVGINLRTYYLTWSERFLFNYPNLLKAHF